MQKFTSLTVQMIYVTITGFTLIFMPNFLLQTFGFQSTQEVWIRILGVIVFVLAILYNAIKKSDDINVIKSTIWGRAVAGAFIILLSINYSMPNLVLFAGIDLATAAWTWYELSKK